MYPCLRTVIAPSRYTLEVYLQGEFTILKPGQKVHFWWLEPFAADDAYSGLKVQGWILHEKWLMSKARIWPCLSYVCRFSLFRIWGSGFPLSTKSAQVGQSRPDAGVDVSRFEYERPNTLSRCFFLAR